MVFNRSNRGGRDFNRRSFNGGRDGDRQMFKAICSNCGKECEVPFRPTGNKPVYCSDCFRTMGMGGGNDSRRFDDRDSRRPQFDNGSRGAFQPNYKEQFEALNNKLDKILKLLNPETSGEAQKVIAGPQVENLRPIKKAKVKKQISVESQAVPAITASPTETPTE